MIQMTEQATVKVKEILETQDRRRRIQSLPACGSQW
jgi:hypothetical protein